MSKFIDLSSRERSHRNPTQLWVMPLKEAGVRYDILHNVPTWLLKEQEVF